MNARDIMTQEVRTLSPECTIGEAVRQFAQEKIQSFPIIDANRKLLGTLNLWKILEHVLPDYLLSGELREVGYAPDLKQIHERLVAAKHEAVSSLMTVNPPVVSPDDSVLACATLIMNTPKTVYLLPVVDTSQHLLGIIAPWDIIKEIAQ
ncbi:CBS domain-containing protein [Candidatus Nitronereus thalassa]|uniref:CBS domain-containing protein n=1 Tax=Candidatus Nitronereus thalassa TaxID=3020898 RepID=A0ABU3K4N0_9BACT|nr:CBS domain-containing protein [Candidatus Nitronereus thalassa]MDT7041328.1 CBS domain-containing protein [Candidatus Nitronereus thalassa]